MEEKQIYHLHIRENSDRIKGQQKTTVSVMSFISKKKRKKNSSLDQDTQTHCMCTKSRRRIKWDLLLFWHAWLASESVSQSASQPVRAGWAGERQKNMKTQIIPWWCSPHSGLHRSLTCCVPLHCPQTSPLSPLYPSPLFLLHPPSIASPPTPTPNARSRQAVSGARCGGEIATRMYKHWRMSTQTLNTWCFNAS